MRVGAPERRRRRSRWAGARIVAAAGRSAHDLVRAGAATLPDVLEPPRSDPLVAAVRLLWVLESLPGARKIDTRRALASHGPRRPPRPLARRSTDGGRAPRCCGDLRPGLRWTVTAAASRGRAAARRVPGHRGLRARAVWARARSSRSCCRRDPRLWLSRSWTTRERRPGGVARRLPLRDRASTSRTASATGGFLEWIEFLDYLQGSPLPEPPGGRDVLFEIDVRGAANVKRAVPRCAPGVRRRPGPVGAGGAAPRSW